MKLVILTSEKWTNKKVIRDELDKTKYFIDLVAHSGTTKADKHVQEWCDENDIRTQVFKIEKKKGRLTILEKFIPISFMIGYSDYIICFNQDNDKLINKAWDYINTFRIRAKLIQKPSKKKQETETLNKLGTEYL